MTVQLRDSDGTVRLSGDLLAAGGAPGDVLTQQADGTYAPAAGGGSLPGVAALRGPFPFAFDTPGLNNGVTIYTPTVGEWILGLWINVTTIFNGTTPLADVGAIDTYGFFSGVNNPSNTPMPLTVADSPDVNITGVTSIPARNDAQTLGVVQGIGVGGVGFATVLGVFTAAHPLKVWASEDGTRGGTAIDSTAGAAAVWLLTAIPS